MTRLLRFTNSLPTLLFVVGAILASALAGALIIDAFNNTNNFRQTAMIYCLLLLLMALGWGYLTRSFTRRVADLVAATSDLAQGDLERRTSLSGRDEFARLAQAFNQMAEQIQSSTRALRESEERYRRIVETAYEGIFVLDGAQRLTFANRRLAEMVGSTPEAIVGRPLSDYLFEEDRADHHNCMTYRNGPARYERRLRRQDGTTVWTIMSSNVLRDPGGNFLGAIGMATDITQRRELELQLRKAQRMEAVSQLAGGVAHQFNNILTVIIGYAQFLTASSHLDEEETKMIAEISDASKRAADLARQLQLLGRSKPMEHRPFNLNELLLATADSIRQVAGVNINVQINCNRTIPMLIGDSGMMRQAIENLAANAREAMPEGGRLTISTESAAVAQGQHQINPEAYAGEFVCLRVADTSKGMDEAQLRRVFEPSFAKPSGNGNGNENGIGLATVYGVVKQHQGWIEVSSTINQGTSFAIYLPVHSRLVVAQQEPTKPLPASNKGGDAKTILLVEDNESLRAMAAACLARSGYQVLEAADADAACELWFQHGDRVDLLFTDVLLPGSLDGGDLARRFKAQRPELKVLFSTGYNREMAGLTSDWLAREKCLSKPFDPRRLVETVSEVLGPNSQLPSSQRPVPLADVRNLVETSPPKLNSERLAALNEADTACDSVVGSKFLVTESARSEPQRNEQLARTRECLEFILVVEEALTDKTESLRKKARQLEEIFYA